MSDKRYNTEFQNQQNEFIVDKNISEDEIKTCDQDQTDESIEHFELVEIICQDGTSEMAIFAEDSFENEENILKDSESNAALKRKKQINRGQQATSISKENESPKKFKPEKYLNMALPQFVISNQINDIDDENSIENPENIRDNDIIEDESLVSGKRHKVKTLDISAIMLPTDGEKSSNIQEISDMCASSSEVAVPSSSHIDDDKTSSIYKCKYCPKAFAAPYHLMIHTRKSHMCQYCLEAFVKVTDLYKHVKEMHNSFDCLLCGRSFRTNGNLRQHMRKVHSVFLPAHVSLLNVEEQK